jgi:hypothetical protein
LYEFFESLRMEWFMMQMKNFVNGPEINMGHCKEGLHGTVLYCWALH